ncbi:hypothetical protein [Steroidobacter agaridevorans]|nr:hypothetical protein [Steroidobacter agaridevorans]
MYIPNDENCTLELVDLGNATLETKQIWFGQLPDAQFGLGFFPD